MQRSQYNLDHWRLCDELSILQASLLYAGSDPGCNASYVENWNMDKRPSGYEAAKTGILNALSSGKIKGRIIPDYESDFNGNQSPIDGTISLQSTVEVDSLRAWLKSRDIKTGFFFPETNLSQPDYLNKNHPRYSKKLAASIRVWVAMEDKNLLEGKAVKDAVYSWLENNYLEFDLVHDGKISKKAITSCTDVVNWNLNGGATKTPTNNLSPPLGEPTPPIEDTDYIDDLPF